MSAGADPAPAIASTGSPGGDRLVVLLARPSPASARTSDAAELATAARVGARISGPVVPQLGLLTVSPPAGVSSAAFARRLRSERGVRSVGPDRVYSLRSAVSSAPAASPPAALTPDDPALSTDIPATPGTTLEWWAPREGFPRAWAMTQGDGAIVAILDTGVDATHPDLQGKVYAAFSHDGNPGDGPPTTDRNGHGTHVASIACADSDNGIGLAGAGYDCRLLIEKIDFSDASIAAAIVQAVDQGADAINMSFGDDTSSTPSAALNAAIHYASFHNVVLVAAAADAPVTEQGPPADALQPRGTGSDLASDVGLSVAAADYSDQRADFSGYGSEISIAAYGADGQSGGPLGIFGAFPTPPVELDGAATLPGSFGCGCRTSFDADTRYGYLAGTSIAAPQVAAVAALIHHLNPDISSAEIVRIIKQTARRPAGTGWTSQLGWGILDAGAAVDAARRIDNYPPLSHPTAPARLRGAILPVRLDASDPAQVGLIASGVRDVELFGAPYGHRIHELARGRPGALIRLHVRAGQRWRLYSIAVDNDGNSQLRPAGPSLFVSVLAPRRHRARRRARARRR